MKTQSDKQKFILVSCYNCGQDFMLSVDENGRIAACIRCPFCGQKTCGE